MNDALAAHRITREAKTPTRARYGWKIENGELVPHVRQQLVIERMKKLRTGEGWSLHQIAGHLNEKRILSATGKKWDHSSVQIVLLGAVRDDVARPEGSSTH